MEENILNISEEQLKELSAKELADLKVETEDLLENINREIEDCKNVISE